MLVDVDLVDQIRIGCALGLRRSSYPEAISPDLPNLNVVVGYSGVSIFMSEYFTLISGYGTRLPLTHPVIRRCMVEIEINAIRHYPHLLIL
jgi:hypothetical protein